MEVKKKGINLLPNEYIVAQRFSFYRKIAAAVAAAEVVCFVNFVALPPKKEVVATQNELLEKQSQLNSPRYSGVNKTLSDLETTKTEIQNWVDACESIQNKTFIGGELLDELTARVPAGLMLTTIDLDDSQVVADNKKTQVITITGSAQTPQQVMNYLSTVEILFPSSVMTHDFSKDDQTGLYNFNIGVTLTVPVAEDAGQTADAGQPADTEQTADADQPAQG